MTETRKIVCDTCGRDITHTGNSIDWRLAVTNQRMASEGGYAVTDMMVYPVTEADTHYCSWNCFATSALVDAAVTSRERTAERGA